MVNLERTCETHQNNLHLASALQPVVLSRLYLGRTFEHRILCVRQSLQVLVGCACILLLQSRFLRLSKEAACVSGALHDVCALQEGRQSPEGRIYTSILWDSTLEQAAHDLAAEILQQAFQHFPSPSGRYGEIAVGRE